MNDITQLSTLYSNAIARAEKAEEALRLIVDWADLVISNRDEFESHHSADMLTGPAFDVARELLNAEREVAR